MSGNINILALSGFMPEHIFDIKRFTNYTGDRNIKHYCGYVADFISQAVHDENIDGVIFPRTCDSTRTLSSYLGGIKKFIFQFVIPERRDELGFEYFAGVLREYKSSLENYFNIAINENEIKERAKIINGRNKIFKEIYKNIESLSFSSYLNFIHDTLKKPLHEQIQTQSFESANNNHSGKRIYLIGSFLSNPEIIKIIENNNMIIAGDNLPESGRLISTPEINLNSNEIYYEIAKSILLTHLSPSQNNFNELVQNDLAEIKNKHADGVIFITQKYCEPYDFLYCAYKKALDGLNIPALKISLTNSESINKAELSIEAFSDTLR